MKQGKCIRCNTQIACLAPERHVHQKYKMCNWCYFMAIKREELPEDKPEIDGDYDVV